MHPQNFFSTLCLYLRNILVFLFRSGAESGDLPYLDIGGGLINQQHKASKGFTVSLAGGTTLVP